MPQADQCLTYEASACRRDDSDLVDNIGRYTEGQLGLFHVKLAADRMVANEYWGKPNSKSPWSLWKINALLGRKAIAAGWKAKTLPPFRPTWELILKMALPANILDAFRQFCPHDKLEEWVVGVTDRQSIQEVAKTIHTELCSAQRVSRLRRSHPAERDVPLENIILLNRDALILRELKYAIKRGDVGSVLNILSHWMLMFRGTGKMPKYADALFHVLVHLKHMNPKLRQVLFLRIAFHTDTLQCSDAFLTNWLANLTGKVDGFKEMDLLQEHQNFWAKVSFQLVCLCYLQVSWRLQIIYSARGSNRSWSWLTMVTVSIFTLRDVIRCIQVQYKIPHNSTSHTSPAAEKDIKDVRDYLEAQSLQSYLPQRENNTHATPVRDLMVSGSAYANKAGAFKNFRRDMRHTTNKGTPDSNRSSQPEIGADDDDSGDHDLGQEVDLDMDDLAMDEEEFPPGTDVSDFVAMTKEVIDELSRYD